MKTSICKLVIVVVGAWITGCNSVVDMEFPVQDDKIVVDGWIENSEQAKVFLTSNSPYFSSIDSASWRDIVLSRAKVTLDDGEKSEVLILRKDARFFPPFYYAGNEIFGEKGKTYTLTAEYGGKSVYSQTTIPDPVFIDTCYLELVEHEDTLGYVVMEFSDPPDEKNYYRIYTKRVGLDEKFIPGFISAMDDRHFSGDKMTINIFRAPKSQFSSHDDSYFRPWETIVVKLSTMDKASFEFWSSYQDEMFNTGNPFASSLSDVHSNITGDGLGIWSGYGSTVDTAFAISQ
jgi:hypothetical protein